MIILARESLFFMRLQKKKKKRFLEKKWRYSIIGNVVKTYEAKTRKLIGWYLCENPIIGGIRKGSSRSYSSTIVENKTFRMLSGWECAAADRQVATASVRFRAKRNACRTIRLFCVRSIGRHRCSDRGRHGGYFDLSLSPLFTPARKRYWAHVCTRAYIENAYIESVVYGMQYRTIHCRVCRPYFNTLHVYPVPVSSQGYPPWRT